MIDILLGTFLGFMASLFLSMSLQLSKPDSTDFIYKAITISILTLVITYFLGDREIFNTSNLIVFMVFSLIGSLLAIYYFYSSRKEIIAIQEERKSRIIDKEYTPSNTLEDSKITKELFEEVNKDNTKD